MTARFTFLKNTRQIEHFWHFNELLCPQNVNVARFARSVEWDFCSDFQTLIMYWTKVSYTDTIGHLPVRCSTAEGDPPVFNRGSPPLLLIPILNSGFFLIKFLVSFLYLFWYIVDASNYSSVFRNLEQCRLLGSCFWCCSIPFYI